MGLSLRSTGLTLSSLAKNVAFSDVIRTEKRTLLIFHRVKNIHKENHVERHENVKLTADGVF